ncbi:MAG: preprotein translocase subunit YajC [Gemmatimonadales bacterium]|nr:preprotein translocase subunit YajC [Gemmatimonadales bacterium]MDX2057196.1 preprotein translocase subunit YajC [Gemmatimonadales bacterium]
MTTLFSLALMAPTDGSSSGLIVLVVQFAALIGIFYFLLIRPQSQARKKHAELLAGLKKGDEVVTAGGVIGKVKEIKDQRITIESGTAQLIVERNRIVQVGSEVSPTAAQ